MSDFHEHTSRFRKHRAISTHVFNDAASEVGPLLVAQVCARVKRRRCTKNSRVARLNVTEGHDLVGLELTNQLVVERELRKILFLKRFEKKHNCQ